MVLPTGGGFNIFTEYLFDNITSYQNILFYIINCYLRLLDISVPY